MQASSICEVSQVRPGKQLQADIEAEKAAAIEACLELAAEKIGDIYQPVMDLFYTKFPDAREKFQEFGLNRTHELELSMMESVLYCLMTWFERPKEVEIILTETIPHHIETLRVPEGCFLGLLNTTIDVIASAVETDYYLHGVLESLRSEINKLVSKASSS